MFPEKKLGCTAYFPDQQLTVQKLTKILFYQYLKFFKANSILYDNRNKHKMFLNDVS